MPDHNHIFSVNAVSLTDVEEYRLWWGSGKLKCVFYRLMWKLILMNSFALTRLEGVFITNVAGVVSE